MLGENALSITVCVARLRVRRAVRDAARRPAGWRLVIALALGWLAAACLAAVPAAAAVSAAAAGQGGGRAAARWESPALLRRMAEDFVRRSLPAGATAASVHAGSVPAHFPRCAGGRLHAQGFGNPNPYGEQTVELRCDAPQAWSLYLPVVVHWPQPVVVAAHALAPGHALSDADLQVVRRDRASLPPGALERKSQATGRVLQRGVAAGEPVTADMLAGPELVHYGQAVSLIAEGEGIRLVALGIALQDGSQGQTVLVRNAQSGKVVSGVVDARGDVVAALLR